MAKKEIKMGYLDDEFRKTAIGRSASKAQSVVNYQKQIAARLNIPSNYLKAAQSQVSKAGIKDPAVSSKPSEAKGKGVSNIRNSEFTGYSEAQGMDLLRKQTKTAPSGTLLGS
tara:strand:+ start:5087 stop:5425 length:339 start_codon:yes stop_codon:yes gene_type:complete